MTDQYTDEAGRIFDEAWAAGGHDHTDDQILAGVYVNEDQAAGHFTGPAEPLAGAEIEPRPFDARELLPARLAEYVRAVAEHLEVPNEAAAFMAIGALSSAAVGRYRIEGGGSWTQPLILWMTVGMLPGERKSELVRITSAPLRLAEQGRIAQHRQALAEAEEKREALEGAIKAARQKLSKATGDDALTIDAEITKMKEQLDELPDKDTPFPRLLVEDLTEAALSQRLMENDEALGILTAEGGLFGNVAGRYSDGLPNWDIYLKSYDEEYIAIDRISRGTVVLSHPALAMGVAAQPGVILDAARIPGAKDRGFLGRWFYALPKSTLGHRKNLRTKLAPEQHEWWSQTVQRVLDTPPRSSPVPYLALTPEADKLLQGLLDGIEPHLDALTGRFAHMSDWASKLAGKTLRLAGLFHLAQGYGTARKVDEATMTSAVAFSLWTIHHAERVYQNWKRSEDEVGVEPILTWIRRKRPATFTAGDLKTSLRNAGWYSPEARDAALIRLHRNGWIASTIQYDRAGKRRSTGTFVPRPELLAGAK
ncbi:YfjI family protein [Actinomadura sp. WMMA1423]|uniref:YfjI family protein n=1 Tax=Actinomadura sp. WMMA1423 TaxID=2591108 RepID=UPI001146C1EB|nr:YfjI family protein [Actinomadura sp. WMMA1423]